MELSFQASHGFRSTNRRQRRQRRAHWWFQQMRQVVERALDRESPAPPTSEQIYFSLPRRPASSQARSEQGELN